MTVESYFWAVQAWSMFGMYLMAIGRPKGEAIICAAMVGALALLGVLEMVTDSIKMDICSRYEQAL